MKTQGFTSRQERGSLIFLEGMFSKEKDDVYFIEDEKTHQWYAGDYDLEKMAKGLPVWTTDPLYAKLFNNEVQAIIYAIQNDIAWRAKTTWIITKHEL